MLKPHKVSTLIFKLLVIIKSWMLIIKLLHSDLFPIVEYSLVNHSIPAITNYVILGKLICNTF
uniref:Uncharacterized protein n=1 Tax=Arundo donax TaxID=35708 RepID=A0A0A9FCK6_ARUDO